MVSTPVASSSIVLSFGPSILTSAVELDAVVTEVLWHMRRGKRVVVVPSALWGAQAALAASVARATDARPARAGEELSPAESAAAARVINAGPQAAAGLAALALNRAGVNAVVLGAAELRLTGRGGGLDATPVSIDAERIGRELDRGRIVIVPGGEAITENGEPATLGVGGVGGVGGSGGGSERATNADVTAVFVAQAIGAEVRLVRDTDGVFEGDPFRRLGGRPRRFRTIAWDLVGSVAPGILSVRAAQIAQALGVSIRIAAPGSDAGSAVGGATSFDLPVLPREAATARALVAAVA